MDIMLLLAEIKIPIPVGLILLIVTAGIVVVAWAMFYLLQAGFSLYQNRHNVGQKDPESTMKEGIEKVASTMLRGASPEELESVLKIHFPLDPDRQRVIVLVCHIAIASVAEFTSLPSKPELAKALRKRGVPADSSQLVAEAVLSAIRNVS